MSLQIHRQCCASHKQVRKPTEKNKEKNLLAPPCKTSGAVGGNKENIPAAPLQHRQKDVFGLHTKHAPQNGCETTQGRGRIRQFMYAAALRTKHKHFPTLLDTCLQIDSLSHWTLHDIVFHSARFSTQRQLMPCFTSAAFANDW